MYISVFQGELEEWQKSEFDILCKKFVSSTCMEKERRNVEWLLYLLSGKNFILTNALVWNNISVKLKMSMEEFISLLSPPGKLAAVLMTGYAVATCFLWTQDSSHRQLNIN